eukprot:CAMPEP_0184855442 /NCGR_PEP_ID=MMETSP0580-20130426/690_1 /TAXON_ID=1118495 /ORGANISM="Dactyliosolen fragilissimus" /LENGTH=404 /DNA_ID=CAMNT_0027349955 /DNA_START=325 /DNA_END=1539 /DNA_ORIENTATION=-
MSKPTYGDESETNWKVQANLLRKVPSYYPIEKTSTEILNCTPDEIASKISECCRILSIEAIYNEGGTAMLHTIDNVEIFISLWQGVGVRGSIDGHSVSVIVEIQRRKGSPITYQKYCRKLLDAAQGKFASEISPTKTVDDLHTPVLKQINEDKSDSGNAKKSNALIALEIAANLLKKDRMDARQLGMESLCLLTDPSRTCLTTALIASRVVLLGSVGDENTDDEEVYPEELGIREAIISLVQFGKLSDGCGFNPDFGSEENKFSHPEEDEHNANLHNLALAVLANALDVLGKNGNGVTTNHSIKSDIANHFIEESNHTSNREIISSLLKVLSQANSKPHDAFLSAHCLTSLFQASEDARKRAKELNAKQIVISALDVGRRTHAKLENETEKLILVLQRQADDQY